jgi:glycosyltransferase involved in cell wall biosynthesis
MTVPGKLAPRVLILVQNLPVPFDRRVWLEARALRDAGCRVTVICPKGQGAMRSREELDGIRILRYRAPEARSRRGAFVIEFAWSWLRTLLLSLRAALGGRFHAIHACNPPDTLFAIALFHRVLGTRFVYDQHDLCPELYLAKYPAGEGDAFYRWLLRLEGYSYRSADAVLATNESYRGIAIGRGGVAREKTFVVRSGPDPERIREEPPCEAERQGARHVLGYLGTMSTQDGVDGLLRAFARVVHEHGRNDVHLVLVGGGPLLDQMRALSVSLDVAARVTFHGRVHEGASLRRILSSTDLCISPDPPNPLNELSTMNKTMEYMAFGRPVLAYDLRETRVSGGSAIAYARAGDEKELAWRIVELLDDPQLREELARRGRERVREQLAWHHSIPALLAAYRSVLGPRASLGLR